MSGKAPYTDVTQQVDGHVNGTNARPSSSEPQPESSKAREAREEAEAAARNGEGSSEPPPPQYGEHPTASSSSNPPRYTAEPQSLAQEVTLSLNSLANGPPDETISVPMIHSTEQRSFKDFLKGRSGKVSQTVSVRKMTRGFYLKHYAKDAEGNYVGTERPAPDAGLVFVPGKSTPEDLLEQVQKVAFGKLHYVSSYGTAYAGVGGGMGGGVGGGA